MTGKRVRGGDEAGPKGRALRAELFDDMAELTRAVVVKMKREDIADGDLGTQRRARAIELTCRAIDGTARLDRPEPEMGAADDMTINASGEARTRGAPEDEGWDEAAHADRTAALLARIIRIGEGSESDAGETTDAGHGLDPVDGGSGGAGAIGVAVAGAPSAAA